MPVSNPKLHELLAQCFDNIQSPAAASYHVRRAELLRNRSAQPVTPSHDARPERRASTSDPRAGASAGDAPKTDKTGKQASSENQAFSENLLKRARSRSRFSELPSRESLGARSKRQRMHADAEPSIQPIIVQHPPHVHDSKPYDKNNYMPSLKAAVRMLEKECNQNGESSPKVRFSFEIDDDKKEMGVSIDIKVQVPDMAKKATDGVVKVKDYCRFGTEDDITEKGAIYEKARNRSARLAVADVNDIRRVIEKACYSELRVAFERAKTIILSEAKGNLYGASVSLYGSVPTGLILGESDIDVSISVPMLFESRAQVSGDSNEEGKNGKRVCSDSGEGTGAAFATSKIAAATYAQRRAHMGAVYACQVLGQAAQAVRRGAGAHQLDGLGDHGDLLPAAPGGATRGGVVPSETGQVQLRDDRGGAVARQQERRRRERAADARAADGVLPRVWPALRVRPRGDLHDAAVPRAHQVHCQGRGGPPAVHRAAAAGGKERRGLRVAAHAGNCAPGNARHVPPAGRAARQPGRRLRRAPAHRRGVVFLPPLKIQNIYYRNTVPAPSTKKKEKKREKKKKRA
ncbi:poly(A) RNA polymerase mitochondrial precursor [Gracilaria domingensis]|nr:poly(A) RNA polymerase mitochondrial precursor [Gracilaria domingensis]